MLRTIAAQGLIGIKQAFKRRPDQECASTARDARRVAVHRRALDPPSLAPSFDEPRHEADDQDGKDDRYPDSAVATHPIADAPHATVHHGFAFVQPGVGTE